jgi:hypothetical protein
MFYYLLLLIPLTPFFYYQGHIMVKNTISDNYQKCKKLKTVVQVGGANKKGNCKAMYITFRLICSMLWIMFLQHINTTIRKVNRKTSELTYVIAGRKYKLLIKPKRGPVPILQISNEKSEDVTNEVLPFMGPQYDWHGQKFTPCSFNCKVLTFECADGSSQSFKNEAICSVIV